MLARTRGYDLVVVGGGIVGLCAAEEALRRQPNLRVAILDRALSGMGASASAAGLVFSYGRTARVTAMASRGTRFYRDLGERSRLPIDEFDLYVIGPTDLRADAFDDAMGAPRLAVDIRRMMRDLTNEFPSLRLAEPSHLFSGVRALACDAAAVTTHIGNGLRTRVDLLEGCAVEGWEAGDNGTTILLADGRTLNCQALIVAPGPWCSTGPTRAFSERQGIRIKKVVSLHVFAPISERAVGLLFSSEDAFLMPLRNRGHWLFSYTCQEWDCSADQHSLRISSEDRNAALSILERYVPDFVGRCHAGRVFCDSYAPDWCPVVSSIGNDDRTIFVGACSGSGFRLAPGLAHEAVARLPFVTSRVD